MATISMFFGIIVSPEKQAGWVKTWIELHQEELAANWEIAIKGGEVYKIAPLQK